MVSEVDKYKFPHIDQRQSRTLKQQKQVTLLNSPSVSPAVAPLRPLVSKLLFTATSKKVYKIMIMSTEYQNFPSYTVTNVFAVVGQCAVMCSSKSKAKKVRYFMEILLATQTYMCSLLHTDTNPALGLDQNMNTFLRMFSK